MAEQIKVPEGMLNEVVDLYNKGWVRNLGSDVMLRGLLEAALRWLSENPVEPTPAQAFELNAACAGQAGTQLVRSLVSTWQRRMFLAPEETPADGTVEFLNGTTRPVCVWWQGQRCRVVTFAKEPQPDVSRVEGFIPRAITFTHAEADYLFDQIRTAAHGWSPNTATCAVPDRRGREEAR